MKVSEPKHVRFFYTRDFAGVHAGPYSLVVYAPSVWTLYFHVHKYGASIQVGPIGWFWFTDRMPF